MADYPLPSHPVHAAAANHYLVTREELAKMAKAAGVTEADAFVQQWLQPIIGAVAAFLLDRDPTAAATTRQMAAPVLAAILTRSARHHA